MSGALGLKNSFGTRVYWPLMEYRGGENTPGHDIGLIEFMQTRATNEEGKAVGLKNASGNPIDWVDIWTDLGINPAEKTLDNLISFQGDDMKYLAPEIVRAFILEGLETDATYRDLIAGTENVNEPTVTAPWIKIQNEEPQTIGEAEYIPESGILWGEKSVKMAKDAIAIHFTDELLLAVKLPLLRYWLRKVGASLNARMFTRAVTTLINGDQADTSDACTIIGSTDGTSVKFVDFLRVWLRGQLIGQRWETIICNEKTAFEIMQLDEFSNPQGAGAPFTQMQLRNRIVPSSMPIIVSSAMSDGDVMLFDQRFAMLYLSYRGLLVESERIIMRQLQGTAVSVMGGWLTIDMLARIIIDGDALWVEDTSTDFPTAFTPVV